LGLFEKKAGILGFLRVLVARMVAIFTKCQIVNLSVVNQYGHWFNELVLNFTFQCK
jgi:hypothetical protein